MTLSSGPRTILAYLYADVDEFRHLTEFFHVHETRDDV